MGYTQKISNNNKNNIKLNKMAFRFDNLKGLRLILVFLIISILVSSPFIYSVWRIKDIYISSEAREKTLDSIFFLREEYGLTIADLTIKQVERRGPDRYITIHETYHGFLDEQKYDDIDRDYIIFYEKKSDNMSIFKIIDKK